jgi:hypothetical protein
MKGIFKYTKLTNDARNGRGKVDVHEATAPRSNTDMSRIEANSILCGRWRSIYFVRINLCSIAQMLSIKWTETGKRLTCAGMDTNFQNPDLGILSDQSFVGFWNFRSAPPLSYLPYDNTEMCTSINI